MIGTGYMTAGPRAQHGDQRWYEAVLARRATARHNGRQAIHRRRAGADVLGGGAACGYRCAC
jgi:hypothetical protein